MDPIFYDPLDYWSVSWSSARSASIYTPGLVDVSVCIFPMDVLPRIYRYGYAAPFYNISRSVRSVVFGTKNTCGSWIHVGSYLDLICWWFLVVLNFGVLFVWITISLITLPSIQWYVRRGDKKRHMDKLLATNGEGPKGKSVPWVSNDSSFWKIPNQDLGGVLLTQHYGDIVIIHHTVYSRHHLALKLVTCLL